MSSDCAAGSANGEIPLATLPLPALANVLIEHGIYFSPLAAQQGAISTGDTAAEIGDTAKGSGARRMAKIRS
jgi:hypothetical protein